MLSRRTIIKILAMSFISLQIFAATEKDHLEKVTGAVGDGVALDTQAIQGAIDRCHARQGGVVLVPEGKYCIGTIKLKSNVELRLEEGAELLGSLSISDYARDIQGAVEAPAFDECLIYAEASQNLKITGKGVINGRGSRTNFPERNADKSLADRPMLMRFVKCQNVELSEVTLKDAASWCTHLVLCEDVVVRNVTIDSRLNINNDGFDMDGCNNVLIEDSAIATGDDSICPKSTTKNLTENIVVKNCRVESHTSAFKCGTSSYGGFRNITVADCDFSNTQMGAIKLLNVDGGIMENITIKNIVMRDVEGPIFIRLGNRGRTYHQKTEQIYGNDVKPEGAPVGWTKNIKISQIKATVKGNDLKKQGIMISGIPGHPIENVILEDLDISFTGGGTEEDAKRLVPEDIARYPEQFFFGVLPAWGAYIRHAKNIEFKNVNLTVQTKDHRQRIVLVDVEGFKEHSKID